MEYHGEEHEEVPDMPVSPTGQYFNSSVLSISILAVLESEVPIDDSFTMPMLKDVFLPINPRFSSIMVVDKKGKKKWKRVEVKLEDHVNVPSFPAGMSPEFYDERFNDYMASIALERFPPSKPLWEIHIIKYPTSNAAGNLIFKLHHSLGDGYSLMGALLSCLQRADDPSLPLTFPSRESSSKRDGRNEGIFRCFSRVLSRVVNTVSDFGSTLIMSSFGKDGRTPIRSGRDGVEFLPSVITTLTFSLDHIKQVKAKLGVTINDLVAGIIFLGTRLYMQEAAASPSPHDKQQQWNANANATALVVLNTRAVGGYKTVGEMVKPNSEMPWGNNFTFLQVSIPKLKHTKNDHQASSDPIRFVKDAQGMIKRKRNSAAIFLTGWMLEILRKFKGPEAAAQYVYNTLNSSSMAMTNMIGPVEQIALANHPCKGMYFTLVGGPESLAITIMSYVGKLRITIRAEKGFIDPRKYNSCIENAFDMISKAAVHYTPPSNTKEV